MLGRARLGLGLAALVASVAALPVPTAAASLPSPGGFRLQASNSYSLHAVSFDGDPHGQPDALLLLVSRKGSAALYAVQKGVEVTEESISADLGGLGSVDLRFVPTGKARNDAPSCEPKQRFAFDSGSYEGQIDFEGEEGFTEVHATRARGDAHFLFNLICSEGVDEGFGGHAPGAQLRVHRRWSHGNLDFEAWKNSPARPTHFEASIEERRGAMGISRSVVSSAGAKAFGFDIPAQTALVRPPSPFRGSARFIRRGGSPGRLLGGLQVDFPGRSNVSFAGARGGLLRYVKNPGHPFLMPR